MKQIRILTTIGVFLLHSSHNFSSENNGTQQSLYANLKQQDEVSVFDIFESIDIILLETGEQSLIADIRKIIHFNDRYYIFDKQQQRIFCFDSVGNFLFKISQKGYGLEEYTYIDDFNVDPFNNQLLLLEPFGNLLTFDLNGQFISKIRLPSEVVAYNEVYIMDENRLMFTSLFNFGFVFYDRAKNAIIDRHYGVEEKKLRFGFSPFVPLNRAYNYNEDLFLLLPLSNDVINLSDNSVFSWNFGKLNNMEETIENLKNFILLSNKSEEDFYMFDWVGEKKLNYIVHRSFETSRYKICVLEFAEFTSRYVFYDKKTEQTFVFETTREGINLAPHYFFGESIILHNLGVESFDNFPVYYNLNILTETQKQLLQSRKDNDNPFLIKYNFKQ